MKSNMTFKDANGNAWDTAEEALEEFISDLPYLTDNEIEKVFKFTDGNSDAASNLSAIAYGVKYSGLDYKFEGDNYPVPFNADVQPAQEKPRP